MEENDKCVKIASSRMLAELRPSREILAQC